MTVILFIDNLCNQFPIVIHLSEVGNTYMITLIRKNENSTRVANYIVLFVNIIKNSKT